MTRHQPAVVCEGVERSYGVDGSAVAALRGVSLSLPAGTITALVGPSGSGKSTLLRLLACVDRPDAGRITIDGQEVAGLSRARRVRLRRTRLGFLYQSPADNLLEYLTVREHLLLGASLRGLSRHDPQITALLDRLGLAGRADHRPRQLSGGEQQRTAIAFAAIGPPALLVADEPTGQLDHTTADEVVAALRVMATTGVAVVAATHDPAVARQADRVVQLRDGQIVEKDTGGSI
jgi:putative ABC transport system ATP-binding protein